MDDFRLPLRSDYDRNPGYKWRECHLCGPRVWRALVHFDSGSVEPTVGETVTGATSADTGVIANVTKTSGTYAGGDAVGIIEMTSPTGYDECILEIFTDNETLNGSTSGTNFATVNKTGAIQVWGRLIPDKDIVEYRGKFYCRPHFIFKHRNEWLDDEKPEQDEGDREKCESKSTRIESSLSWSRWSRQRRFPAPPGARLRLRCRRTTTNAPESGLFSRWGRR